MNAAKLIRTCKAMRVFSGRISTGPQAATAASTAPKVARTCGSVPAKCRSRSPSGAHVWTWLRLAKLRPQAGQAHMPVMAPVSRPAGRGTSGPAQAGGRHYSGRVADDQAGRVDSWIWSVRLIKTRSAGSAACRAGHVRVNGVRVKPAHLIRPGDEVRLRQEGRERIVVVVRVISKRTSAPDAAACYTDHSPPPPP